MIFKRCKGVGCGSVCDIYFAANRSDMLPCANRPRHFTHTTEDFHEPMPPADINATLAERGSRYGEFKDQAVYAQGMADIARKSPNWGGMAPDQKEGLSIIFNKIGRILNGDPDYSDSWHDIAGYATLVDKRLKAEGK